jgi:hypothetical protein
LDLTKDARTDSHNFARELQTARAESAALRQALEREARIVSGDGFDTRTEAALASGAGAGWTPPEKVKVLVDALWGFDFCGERTERGYFCAGCDLDGLDRAGNDNEHDAECRTARAALRDLGDTAQPAPKGLGPPCRCFGVDQGRVKECPRHAEPKPAGAK